MLEELRCTCGRIATYKIDMVNSVDCYVECDCGNGGAVIRLNMNADLPMIEKAMRTCGELWKEKHKVAV